MLVLKTSILEFAIRQKKYIAKQQFHNKILFHIQRNLELAVNQALNNL